MHFAADIGIISQRNAVGAINTRDNRIFSDAHFFSLRSVSYNDWSIFNWGRPVMSIDKRLSYQNINKTFFSSFLPLISFYMI